MTSKWIEVLEDIYADGGDWEDLLPHLESIDKLLVRAMLETDDEILHEDIMKELAEETKQLKTASFSVKLEGLSESEIPEQEPEDGS